MEQQKLKVWVHTEWKILESNFIERDRGNPCHSYIRDTYLFMIICEYLICIGSHL